MWYSKLVLPYPPPPFLGLELYVRNQRDSFSPINQQVMFTSHFLFPSVLHHYLPSHWYLIQVLAGDLEEAICTHALHYSIWRRYDAMPERFDWHQKAPNVRFYPLRPELVESTYLLYQVCAWSCSHSFFFHMYVPADPMEVLYELDSSTVSALFTSGCCY